MRQLPTGTVTLLFTDIEGSTRLLDELGAERYVQALETHRRLLREAVRAHDGVEVETQGDSFHFAFASARNAALAASDAQRALADAADHTRIAVRIGIHTGEPIVNDGLYAGIDVHLAARVMGASHGGQVLITHRTASELAIDDGELSDLGEHRLKDFDEPVPLYQLGEGKFPPLKTISNTNLPRPASSFVGRERELAELLARIEQGARLLTLTGPGGSGKTRLALEAAATLVPEYKAGVFWVGLAALRDPVLVTETIAQTLGAKDGLAQHIGERELLLLLDNLEQVIDAAPELSKLLEACPLLTLLVTSRELLRVQGEQEYAVPPLAESEAVELFCARAQTEPSNEIAELCARLDNLPLAVELAAPRTNVLSPAQILARLAQRLDLLKGGRDADPRQQTLRATIAWSYDLLSDEEQTLFRRLAVFAGGCTLEAAEKVCRADLDTLQLLVEKSLLRFTNERYWMLETIRDYALEQLQGSDEMERLREMHAEPHAAYFVSLAEGLEPPLIGSVDERWVPLLHAELDNLRAALHYLSTRPDPTRQLRLVGSLFNFWEAVGRVAEGRRCADEALARSDRPELRHKALYAAFACAIRQADWTASVKYAEEHLAIARRSGDRHSEAVALNAVAIANSALGESETATSLWEESAALARKLGDERLLQAPVFNLAEAALTAGDFERAKAVFEERLEVAVRLGDSMYEVAARGGLGEALFSLGESTQAAKHLRDALRLTRGLGRPGWTAGNLKSLAAVAVSQGDAARAARLAATADVLLLEAGEQLPPASVELVEATELAGRRALGDEGWETAYAEGTAMSLDEAVEYALAEN